MLLFRSEEGITAWSGRTGSRRGAVLPLARAWRFAQAWFGDRLDPHYRGRTPEQAAAIFERCGLRSPFWANRR
ncbi:MAG: hypothetical protein H0W59_05510 [Chloroflexia bacterium]|nr:hypothetical protein [Chloroflexia bacterium]